MPTKESFDIDGLMVFRSDLTAVDQDGNTVASVATPDKYVPSLKEPLSGEQIGRYTNTTAYWREHSTYVPLKGEVIIYSDGSTTEQGGVTVNIPKIKVGDGVTTVGNLPFTDSDTQQGIAGTLNTTNTTAQTPVASESLSGNVNLHKVSKTGSYDDLNNKPTIPTVNDATLTIQKNGTTVDTFSANASQNKTINITVPTTASDVGALPSSTKYGSSISMTVNQTTFVVTAQLKDQDGNNLGNAGTIDLPLESVVVSGSYNAQTKKVVLTLQNGSTIEFSVADLVAGLQSEITAQNPLSADLVVDGTTNKVFTLTMRNKLAGIEEGAEKNVQADWDQDDSDADDFIKHRPDLDATLYESVTYSQLVTKINNSQLVKGRKYRITDYVTTTTQTNTSSAGHVFDLVVTAIDVNKLDHRASALLHSGDTYFSTAGADLSKWQIWYDVNNDTNKYEWADTTNGKGVIYRMIDEWRNDCPYDFKNILFTKANMYTSVYTFNKFASGDTANSDYSLTGYSCQENVIKGLYYKELNFIVILNGGSANEFSYTSHDIVLRDGCSYNVFEAECYDIDLTGSTYNFFAYGCATIVFGNNCSYNTLERECYDVTFYSYCQNNRLGGYDTHIEIDNNGLNNNIGFSCSDIYIGVYCYYNTLGDYCNNVILSRNCQYNIFGGDCNEISLSNACYNISIGGFCTGVVVGNSSNQGGDYCKDIIIEKGNKNIRIYNTSSPSASNYLQNIYIAQGCSGTASAYTEISTIARNLSYRTTVGRDSSGNIRIYNEDDPQVQANWNETNSSSPSYIQHKPNLATVATSGSYNDLSNTPTIPTVPTHRTINHEQITDSSLGDINLHDGFYYPNAVQDYDGNWYGAVVIGDQVWLGENLRTKHLPDGTEITSGNPSTTALHYKDYTSHSLPVEKRGLLYSYAVTSRIAPQGWKFPSESEFAAMAEYLGKQTRYSSAVAKAMAATSGWSSSETTNAVGNDQTLNNASGFNMYPTGTVNSSGSFVNEKVSTIWASTNKGVYIYGGSVAYYSTSYGAGSLSLAIRLLSTMTPIQFRDWYVKTYGSLQHNIFNVQAGQDLEIIPNKLPYGYEELEYLESSGTQYINTGVSLGVNSTVFISATAQGKGDVGIVYSFDQDYYGSYMQDNGSMFKAANLGTNSSNSLVKTNVSSRWTSTASGFTSVHTIGEETSSEYTSTRVDGLNNYITLFKAAAWNVANSYWSGRIYRCLISKNNTLVRNLIPAKRTRDNVLGLYDTVSGTLFTNAGSGTFIAGPVVAIGGKDTIAFTNESGYAILPSKSGNSGKVLAVNSGETGVEWARPVTVYSGSSEPSASLGEDGDIYILAS